MGGEVSHTEGREQTENAGEQCVEESILTREGGGDGRVKRVAL